MIEMVNIRSICTFRKWTKAVPTGELLGFQLGLYVLSGKLAFKRVFASDVSLCARNSLFWIRLIPSPPSCAFLFRMVLTVARVFCTYLFWILLTVLLAPRMFPFPIVSIMLPMPRKYLFTVSLIVLAPSCAFLFTVSIGIDFVCFVPALFAASKQPVSIFMEVVRSSRQPAFTVASALLLRGIVLWYYVHDRSHPSVRSGVLQVPPGVFIFVPPLYRNPPCKASLGGIAWSIAVLSVVHETSCSVR